MTQPLSSSYVDTRFCVFVNPLLEYTIPMVTRAGVEYLQYPERASSELLDLLSTCLTVRSSAGDQPREARCEALVKVGTRVCRLMREHIRTLSSDALAELERSRDHLEAFVRDRQRRSDGSTPEAFEREIDAHMSSLKNDGYGPVLERPANLREAVEELKSSFASAREEGLETSEILEAKEWFERELQQCQAGFAEDFVRAVVRRLIRR